MRPLHVAIRADASAQIGLGHVKRSASLASALRMAGAKVCLVTRALGADIARAVADDELEVLTLDTPSGTFDACGDPVPHAAWGQVSWDVDASETINCLRRAGRQPDWVVVDHYAFDARWHVRVRDALATRIAAIDDLADRQLIVDLLIDHNTQPAGRGKYAGLLPAAARCLLGPRFALLSPRYASAPRWASCDEVKSIGIFMGGADAINASAQVLATCRDAVGFQGLIEIATTTANPNLRTLAAAASACRNVQLLIDQPDLTGFYARHGIQVGAGGGAMWERCCIGAPTIALVTAANQRATIPGLAAMGAVLSAEPGEAGAEACSLSQALRLLLSDRLLRERLSTVSRSLVDGLGTQRVALAMASETLKVRPACPEDARMMYEWRNHPTTRAVSETDAPIAWEDHVAWLHRTMRSDERHLMIGVVGDVPVGVIRFDGLERGQFLVSLYLAPALHGLGLGHRLLAAGENALACKAAGSQPHIVAKILPENLASQRMFRSCGYRLHDDNLWHKPPAAASAPHLESTR